MGRAKLVGWGPGTRVVRQSPLVLVCSGPCPEVKFLKVFLCVIDRVVSQLIQAQDSFKVIALNPIDFIIMETYCKQETFYYCYNGKSMSFTINTKK